MDIDNRRHHSSDNYDYHHNIIEISLDQNGKFWLDTKKTVPYGPENIYEINEEFFNTIKFGYKNIVDIINDISFKKDSKYSLVKKDFLSSSETKACIYLKIPKEFVKKIPNTENVNELANNYHKRWAKETTIQYRHAFSCFILAFVFLLFKKSYWV